MNNKKNIAFRNKTIPDYITDKGNVIFKKKEWMKDPLINSINIKKNNIKLYINYILQKNFIKWKRSMGWNELKEYAPQIIASNIDANEYIDLIENILYNLENNINEYQINIARFNTLYKTEKKENLKKTSFNLEPIIPKQIKQSVIFKTPIKSLLYHFNNIKLGNFAFAMYDNYVKLTPYVNNYIDIINMDTSDKYILLSDNVTQFYVSICTKGLLVEFNYNYYIEKFETTKCNFIDRKKNVINTKKILDEISKILQLKSFEELPEDYTQATFQIKFSNIDKSIWAYLAMNNKIFSKYITIPELRLSKLNNRFFFKLDNFKKKNGQYKSYLELKNKKVNFGEITANYINISENIVEIFISRSLGKDSIKLFQKQLLSLLEYHYKPNIKKVINIYKSYKIQLDIIKPKSKKKKSLKNNYPGYFNIGYSTNCGPKKQPTIISEKEVKKLIKKKIDPNLILKSPASPKDHKLIESGKYPNIKNYINSQGYNSLYFVCNKKNIHGYIPADYKNNYPRLNIDDCPCCKTKKKSITLEKSETSSYTKGNALCKGICALPLLLKKLFIILDPTKEYHRQSSTPDILNLLNAIFKKNFTKNHTSEYKFLGVSKQENWDILDIKSYINNSKYIDVNRCIRILEELYQCKLFIFKRDKAVSRNIIKEREVPTLFKPIHNYYTNYYSWNTSNRPILILFAHFGTAAHTIKNIHYELLTQTDWKGKIHKHIFTSNDYIIKSLYKYQNMINESYCLNKEILPISNISFHASEQIIDYYGKCRGVLINKTPILFNPIPPMNMPYKNLSDIQYLSRDKILKTCKALGIENIKKQKDIITGKYMGLNIFIPVKNDEKLNKFNENRKNTKHVIGRLFYLFSKFWKETKSIDINKFLTKYIIIDKDIRYDFKDITLKKYKKIIIASNSIKKKLGFVLKHKLAYDNEELKLYYKNKIIRNYFNEIRDFNSYAYQIIVYKDSLQKYDSSNLLIRLKDEQLDTMSPYFVKNMNKLWIYQNCQSKKIKKKIIKIWETDAYNNVNIIQNSKEKFLAKLQI